MVQASAISPARPVEGRRERKKRVLRTHIYQTARELFLSRGFEGTTVEQIADAADVAPATFFNHFQNKQAVLADMTGEVFERLESLIDEQLARRATAQERIRAFADEAASQIEQSRSLAHDVLLELIRTTASHGQIAPYLARTHEPFTKIVAEGQAAGEVRTDLDPAFLAEMVIGAINAALINWINDPDYPLEQRVRQAAAFVAEAISVHP